MNEIKAICGKHAVLEDGKVQAIGYITDKKRYTGRGCLLPTEIVFHYGFPHKDRFYFENNQLTYMAVCLSTPDYLCDLYAECAAQSEISPSEFVAKITAVYVFTTLGF